MYTDLMGTPGLQVHAHQRGLAETLHHIPMRDRLLAGRGYGEAEIGHLGTPDRRIDSGPILLEVALNQGMVGLDHLMLGELPPHLLVRQLRLAHQHQTGGADVQPAHDPLPPGRTVRGDMHPAVQQAAEHRGTGPSHRGVRGDAYRLVHNYDIVVLIDDAHVVGNGFGLAAFLLQIELHHVAGLQYPRFRHVTPQYARLPAGNQVGRLRP